MDEISLTDCCEVILSDWHYRRPEIDPELRNYKIHLLALLNAEFAIEWSDDANTDAAGLTVLPRIMLDGFRGLTSPFAGLLEYRFQPGQRETWAEHADRIYDTESELKRLWVTLFKDLLLLRWPEAAKHKTTWTRLRELGLGEPLDEIDFL